MIILIEVAFLKILSFSIRNLEDIIKGNWKNDDKSSGLWA